LIVSSNALQVDAAVLLRSLPAAADVVKQKRGALSSGENNSSWTPGHGTKRQAAAQRSLIPGNWASWKGLATPGLSGNSAEILLDDILDLQEDLTLKMQELSPQ
jgi:hypothetical protein